jgi:uridine phosphorylase
LKHGDLANRLITVGSAGRAKMISNYFDQSKETVTHTSSRGFVTYTGYYNDVRVSVVAIGMGISMMDFFVRESRAIIDGPIAMIRYGTCGGIATDAPHSKIALANKGSGYIIRNPDAFTQYYHSGSNTQSHQQNPYHVAQMCPADEELSTLLGKNIRGILGPDSVVEGSNVTADSFYCSQARIDDRFHDDNVGLINKIHQHYPDAKTMEMETFILFHLAKCCTLPIKAAAATIIVANRLDNSVIDEETIVRLEDQGGHAVLKTISEIKLE